MTQNPRNECQMHLDQNSHSERKEFEKETVILIITI